MAYKGSPNGGNDSDDFVLRFAGDINFTDKGGGNDDGDDRALYNNDEEEDITGFNKKMPANVVRMDCEDNDDDDDSSVNNDKDTSVGAGSAKDPVNLVNSTDEEADEYLNEEDSNKGMRKMLPAVEGSSNSDSSSVKSHPPFKVLPVAQMPSPQSTTYGL
jgi:hypothetical protein